MPDPQLSGRSLAQQVSDLPHVRKALQDRAALAARRARTLAASSGNLQFAAAVKVTAGTRPGTKAQGLRRSYARVVVNDPAKVDRKTAMRVKRAILRHAARSTG